MSHTNIAKPNHDAPEFGRTVRRCREAAGYPTMASLSRAIGMPEPTLWKIEHETAAPKFSTVLRLVERGGLPLEAFVPAELILAAAERLRVSENRA